MTRRRRSDPMVAVTVLVVCTLMLALGGAALGLWIVNP